jgi:hypothetical protein
MLTPDAASVVVFDAVEHEQKDFRFPSLLNTILHVHSFHLGCGHNKNTSVGIVSRHFLGLPYQKPQTSPMTGRYFSLFSA